MAKDKFEYQYKSEYESDWDIHRNYIQTFDAYEAMLISQVYDSQSRSIDGSKITDSYNTTLAKERADRVIAKLPDGMTESMGKADVGKAAFMDILRQKWIYPNANAQHPFLEKLNMWQLYSSVYGYMPMFYDWNVSTTGYVGPDCWLWNPRHLIPQQGRTSIEDMEYVTALTWVSEKFLKNILDKETEGDGWDREAVAELMERVEQESSSDSDLDTQTEKSRVSQPTKKGICLATRYESGPDGEWIVFAPDHSMAEVRRIKNPHKNGRIPFVIKYSQPLFDSFYGLGDFQRAISLQFARDGLDNFYFKGIKMNLIPPLVANANGVLKHTLDYREGAVMLETIPNSIRRLETSTAGLATYQAAKTALTGSLLSLYGSQNASIPGADALNPSQGKTPAAISMFSDKEATRDGAERRHLEASVEQLVDGFNSLIVNIGTEDIPINLFARDVQDIINSGLTDLKDIFDSFKVNEDGSAGTIKINPKKLEGIEYRFQIKSDSMAKINKDAQRQALENWMSVIGRLQNVIQSDPRVKIQWPTIMETYGQLIDIPQASEFIVIDEQAQPPQAPPPTPKPVSESLNYKDAPEDVKRQIEQMAGLQPSQTGTPPENQGGEYTFQNPDIAQTAEQIKNYNQEPIQPTVNKSGISFIDPQIAQVADAVDKMATKSPKPKPEQNTPTNKE